jgi:phosphoribosylamine--glycine ligase
MKVLVIGGGGREHALVWAIRQSAKVQEIVCAPGNGGIAALARCVPANQKDLDDLVRVAVDEQPDLTVIGPEVPLSLGLVDELTRRGMRVFGPTQRAAQLETSKVFAKEFMQRHNLPTAHYVVCESTEEISEALAHFHAPIVVKADGLAAGKGVVICQSKDEAEKIAAELLSGKFLGGDTQKVILEEFLEGEEISLLVFADGTHILPLAAAQDHKRIGEGDTGPNTGGMGVYSTDKLLEPEMLDWLMTHVAQPVIDGMAAEEAPFTGVLYCGLMMTARGPMVLEFNARFGDPETEAILPRIDERGERGGLLEALDAAAAGRLAPDQLAWKRQPAVTVIAASEGYPGSFTAGHPITGLDEAARTEGVTVFHAGTAVIDDGSLVTSGGRVLAVTALADTLREACDRAYAALGIIHFPGMYYRRDIALRALKEEK